VSSGFFALLDDVAAIAKVAAASLDDTATQAVKVGTKAVGIVIDDTAVTPRYVVGFSADRELPIIAKIAWGSLRNKLIFLLPGALVLSVFAPWAITPLLMAGGAYLCFEGWEKAHEMCQPASLETSVPADAASVATHAADPVGGATATEDAKVAGAIRTDMILSAEIMAISLASIETPAFWTRAAILALVGTLVTAAVYGAVALVVKADDVGVWLARHGRLAATRAVGRGLVRGMPALLKTLGLVGTVAMLWVGGGIILHGLETYGLGALAQALHAVAKAAGGAVGPLRALVTWLVDATGAAVVGLGIGWLAAKALHVVQRT
jgi:uncharacterized protein